MSQHSDNQSTFTRSKHDKEHPYAQISREMIRDKSISPKAKGILVYFLSMSDSWQIKHWKVCEDLNIGKDSLNSAIKEMIESGYIQRTRKKENGLFKCYHYEVSESKIFLPKREIRTGEKKDNSIDDSNNVYQSGKTAAENPLHKNNKVRETKKEQQTLPPSSDVVVSSLEKLNLTEALKRKISKQYAVLEIDFAVDKTLKFESRLSDSATLLDVLKNPNKWEENETKESIEKKNIDFLISLKHLDYKTLGPYKVMVNRFTIEFTHGTNCKIFEVKEKDFIKRVKEFIKKLGG